MKWNDPQLLMPTAPTLRASTFWKVAATGRPGAEHRGARAVDLDVLEVDVGDRVEVLHREVGDQHDRVVGVVEEVVPDHLDVGVDVLLQRVDPDRAEPDVPVQLVRARPDRRVAGDPRVAGERLGPEARSRAGARCPRGSGRRPGCSTPCCRCRRRSRCRWPAPASARCRGRTCCRASSVFSDHIASASSPVLRMKLLVTDECGDAGVEVDAVGDLVGDPALLVICRLSSGRRARCRPWCAGCRGRRRSSR